ncbi:bifunctional UDP-sugar hydrolase/5'-nucleotidase [Pseudoalteromonas sp. MMG013]|uniref:bifunctional UDP-sugar hydrolase/5'-nucleotidase UshA n=1 Tax=Pseudoalteromonas sp. MMG013 TaxID=2822687 RepID=UPI001B396040|nr:bifunctional UDP-sugar hydrolase/5'-nucleotidase UshA [Pseudoalteromonas sp. MMG013]MBQ4860187.1 bifunctional UDP-sugar hydrolase/5'-nucleotidase [Pseudoalteromonas sp. MMG013]
MRITLFASCLLLSACNLLPTSSDNTSESKAKYLTVLHTNDHHGRFWHNEDGEYGMAARKTLIDELRLTAANKGHRVLLLSGGDINTGIPESDLQKAEPDFKGMSLIGYDAMAIGNHEFDNPLSILDKQIAWSNFPLLSANILNKDDHSHAYQPYTIINKGGLTIGIVGLTTVDTAKIANPTYIGELDFVEPSAITKQVVDEIRAKQNIDVMIAVTHMGHYHDGKYGINAPGDVTLARALTPGTLDIIIGGHSQEPICVTDTGAEDPHFAPGKSCQPDQQNGTWIMQAHEWGKYVGKAEFKIENGQKSLLSYELIPVNLKKADGNYVQSHIKPDKKLQDFLQPYQSIGEKQLAKTVGSIDKYLDGGRNTVRFKQSKLADLIIKAQMAAVNADFGLISGGGIRHSIKAGDVSYKDVLKVHPFKNRITKITFTGEQLYQYLNVVTQFPADSGAYLQYYGITFDIESGKLVNLKIKGEAFQADSTYTMSINSYNAAGGDGYPLLNKHSGFASSDLTDSEVLINYLQNHSPIKVDQL